MATHKTAKQIEEDLAKQNARDYGDEERGSTMESSEDVEDIDDTMKKTLGNDAVEDIEDIQEGTYNFTEEIDRDERRESGIVTDKEAEENTKRFKKGSKKAA